MPRSACYAQNNVEALCVCPLILRPYLAVPVQGLEARVLTMHFLCEALGMDHRKMHLLWSGLGMGDIRNSW